MIQQAFQQGDYVRLFGDRFGVVRFFGRVDFSNSILYGIELDEPVGKHDGFEYFRAKPHHGVFVKEKRIECHVAKPPLSPSPNASHSQHLKERENRTRSKSRPPKKGTSSNTSFRRASVDESPRRLPYSPSSNEDLGDTSRPLNDHLSPEPFSSSSRKNYTFSSKYKINEERRAERTSDPSSSSSHVSYSVLKRYSEHLAHQRGVEKQRADYKDSKRYESTEPPAKPPTKPPVKPPAQTSYDSFSKSSASSFTRRSRGTSSTKPTISSSSSSSSTDFSEFLSSSSPVSSRSSLLQRPKYCQSHQSDLHRSRDPAGVIGLKNLGNTCFFNSVMQNLLQTPLTEHFESSSSSSSSSEGILTSKLRSVFHDIWHEEPFLYYNPQILFKAICKSVPRFASYSQQDAVEVLTYLLDGMHEEECRKGKKKFRKSTSDRQTFVRDIFEGRLTSVVTCRNCSCESSVSERFWSLSLPIPHECIESMSKTRFSKYACPGCDQICADQRRLRNHLKTCDSRRYESLRTSMSELALDELSDDLSRCLKKYTSTEILDGIDGYRCENCSKSKVAKKRKASKKLSIGNVSDVLIIHLNRFHKTRFGHEKLNRHVSFPEVLDISSFCSDELRKYPRKLKYRLSGVVVHRGSISGGHYVAYVRYKHRNCSCLDVWYYFSDTRVRRVDIEDVLSSQAYLLFYEFIS